MGMTVSLQMDTSECTIEGGFQSPQKSDRPYGSRARIGLIVPSSNTVAETEFWRMAPAGVSVHTTRLVGATLSELHGSLPGVMQQLEGLGVDVAVYGCTASALENPHEQTRQEIADRLGVPAVTTMGAVLEAFHVLGAKNIAIGAPYPSKYIDAERVFFEEQGFNVTADKGLVVFEGQTRGQHMSYVPSHMVEELAESINSPECDLIFLSCTDMASLDLLEKLEAKLGKPVISSTQATFWKALRTAGISDRLEHCGSLLAEY